MSCSCAKTVPKIAWHNQLGPTNGHVRTRPRADGSIGYSAIVRVFKKKELIPQEQEDVSRRSAAEKWAKARELALEDPTALLRAQTGDSLTLRDLIQWYMDTFRSVATWGRTKQSQLEALKNHTTGQADALLLDSSTLVDHKSPGREQAPNPTNSNRRNVETPYRSLRGRQAARSVYGGVGLGCWKKRMSDRNGPDTGWNITRHESEPTSDGSYVAREYEES